ncbi:MAG: Crp/Fnr family transcriptional regulator, partial [Bacteroidota bacterium]
LTDCQLWVIQKETLERLCREVPKIAQFKERIIEYSLTCKEERVRSLLLDTPQQRYEALLKEQAEIFQRAPLTMIASYLGISRETLHRIRRIR